MEPIDVLGDQRQQGAGFLQLHDGMMDSIWLRIPECFPPFQFIVPMLHPRGFGGHEILIVDGLTLLPDALRSAKIRYATAGGDSGACKNQDPTGSPEVFGKRWLVGFHCDSIAGVLPQRRKGAKT